MYVFPLLHKNVSITRTNVKFPSLYLKKTDLASQNIVHHLNSTLYRSLKKDTILLPNVEDKIPIFSKKFMDFPTGFVVA